MSSIIKLKFIALDIVGKNYLSWILGVETYFATMNLGKII